MRCAPRSQGPASPDHRTLSDSLSGATSTLPSTPPHPWASSIPCLKVSIQPSKISGLPPKTSVLPLKISGLPPKMSVVPLKISGLPPKVSVLPFKISGLPPKMSVVPLKISGLPPKMSVVPLKISGLRPKMSGVQFRFSAGFGGVSGDAGRWWRLVFRGTFGGLANSLHQGVKAGKRKPSREPLRLRKPLFPAGNRGLFSSP